MSPRRQHMLLMHSRVRAARQARTVLWGLGLIDVALIAVLAQTGVSTMAESLGLVVLAPVLLVFGLLEHLEVRRLLGRIRRIRGL